MMERKAGSGPNMTPMVDVVMCILIFFMLGSEFLVPEKLLASDLQTLSAGSVGGEILNQPVPAVRLVLKLERRGDVTWLAGSDGTLLAMDKAGKPDPAVAAFLSGKKSALSATAEVIISPGSRVPYQDVISVYDGCVSARFKQVAFSPAGKVVE